MKYRRVVGNIAALATLAGGSALVAMTGPAYAGSANDGDFPVVGQETVDVVRGSNGKVSGVVPDEPIADTSGASSPTEAAEAHVQRLAPTLGVNPKDLEAVDSTEIPGGHAVQFEQSIGGLDVYAGGFVAALNGENDLQALLGEGVLGDVAQTDVDISDSEASQIALDFVAKKNEIEADGLSADVEGEVAYDPSILNSKAPSSARKAVKVRVHNQSYSLDTDVIVNPKMGNVATSVSNVSDALNRKVCDAKNEDLGNAAAALCNGTDVSYTREEGDSAVGKETVDKVYDHMGTSALWYANYAGIDLTQLVSDKDVAGGKALRATVNVCLGDQAPNCPMQNAFWNFSDDVKQMFVGGPMGTLDVIAHEVTHGVTAETARLKYVHQSGALHEGLSDVMGEIIDLAANPDKRGTDAAWMMGDDLPEGTVSRDLADPTASEMPDTMTSDLWAEDPQMQDNGGVHTNSGVLNKAGYLIAQGGDFNGQQIQGLGYAKTFKIFWSAQNLLTPGADYKDMSTVLQVACEKNLDRDSSYVTESDCAQVEKAVHATEMTQEASDAAPSVAYCDDGSVNRTYFEGFDSREGLTFESNNTGGLAAADFGLHYANTGEDAGAVWTGPSSNGQIVEEGSFTQSSSMTVPENGLLRVDYATEFANNNVNAELQYNAGNGWQSGSELDGSVNAEPWTGYSGGWGSARYDLSSLAGEDVQVRFAVNGGDDMYASILYVDNVKLYNCG